MRYNLEFRKLTFYGLTRPQSIRKSKQISGQTILSSLQDAEFNPNFAKNRDIPVVKNSVTARHASGVNDRFTFNILFNADHMPNSSIQSILHLSIHLSYLEETFCLDTIYNAESLKSRLFWATSARRRRQSPKETGFNKYSGVFYWFNHPSKLCTKKLIYIKFTQCKFGAKKCKLKLNIRQRW